ncbi:DUF3343 domain-containing protein [Desulfovibrio sp. OttesenSCG-928-C14]|nr:DUF3343 domain-containing protein [Desulfovibrio sp. OttesenSCG-928-C14]
MLLIAKLLSSWRWLRSGTGQNDPGKASGFWSGLASDAPKAKARLASRAADTYPGANPGTDRASAKAKTVSGRGFLAFEQTGEVIRAEKALKKAGFKITVKAPPPALRTGCDLVIETPLLQEPAVRSCLREAGVKPLAFYPVEEDLLEPVSLFHYKDLGGYAMIRAANMKITVDKSSLVVVNVSGGGCPDVPFLAALLLGRRLDEAADPLEQGQTLCGYALHLAFKEAKNKLCPHLCAG